MMYGEIIKVRYKFPFEL